MCSCGLKLEEKVRTYHHSHGHPTATIIHTDKKWVKCGGKSNALLVLFLFPSLLVWFWWNHWSIAVVDGDDHDDEYEREREEMRMMVKKSKWTTYAKCVYQTTYVVKKKVEFEMRWAHYWIYFTNNDYVYMHVLVCECVSICICMLKMNMSIFTSLCFSSICIKYMFTWCTIYSILYPSKLGFFRQSSRKKRMGYTEKRATRKRKWKTRWVANMRELVVENKKK